MNLSMCVNLLHNLVSSCGQFGFSWLSRQVSEKQPGIFPSLMRSTLGTLTTSKCGLPLTPLCPDLEQIPGAGRIDSTTGLKIVVLGDKEFPHISSRKSALRTFSLWQLFPIRTRRALEDGQPPSLPSRSAAECPFQPWLPDKMKCTSCKCPKIT